MTSPPSTSSPLSDGSTRTRLGDGTRVDVLEGDPSHEELAAVVVALDEAVTAAAGSPHPPARRSRWRRAARVEAVGGGPVASARDLGPSL